MAATTSQQGKSPSHLLLRDFPSPVLKPWGSHRHHLCGDVDGNERLAGENSSSPPLLDVRRRFSGEDSTEIYNGDRDSGLEELREKLLGHLREVADKMKLKIPPIDPLALGSPQPVQSSAAGESAIPWNLRKRRTPTWREAGQTLGAERTVRRRYDSSVRKDKHKLLISLTSEEIEEDLFSLTGSRPRRRPKKRPRILQRQLDALFPGLWLSEISPESYRVPE